jgi:diguanylate cyclase (GGDEF)-like protein
LSQIAPAPELPVGAVLLEAVLDSVPNGLSVWDDEFRLLLWNAAYLEIYGIPASACWRGMPLAEICRITVDLGNHPGITAADLNRAYEERLIEARSHSPLVFEKPVRERLVKTGYTRVAGIGCIVTHEDVSEQRRWTDALQRREAQIQQEKMRLSAAIENLASGLVLFDGEGKLVVCNARYAEMYHLPLELTRPGTPVSAIVAHRLTREDYPVADAEAYLRQRLERVRARKPATDVVELLDGRIFTIEHRPTSDGGFVATHTDVTDQVQRLRALQEREAELHLQNVRFSTLVNNLDMGVSLFDADKKLVICNDHYAHMYGLSPEDVVPGLSVTEIIANRVARGMRPIGGADAYVRGLMAIIDGGKPHRATSEMRDGRVVAIKHTPIADGGWVTTHQDITEERGREARIRFLARYDGLTQVANRGHLREHLESIEPRLRRGEHVAVLYVDLDHFKAVNDTLGHATGDEVLRQVGARLTGLHRETDLVARLGGDEFAILVSPLDSPAMAAALADRIVKSIAEPFTVGDHQVVIGASVGIAVSPVDGQDAETLMRHADLALYRAKSDGRGTFHFFEAGMDASLQARRTIEIGLRMALARREFRLVFQPVLNIQENRISALEALIRWDHPERGLVSPNEFIPVAEETGLIVAIGEWVLREACLAASKWPRPVRVAVNLSPMQVRHRQIVSQVAAALADSGLPAERLELEITESILLAETHQSLETLHKLRALGVRIAMDDFGTGYSSLSYLRAFPFDKIKIDRSFMQDLSAQDESLAIVKAAIGLGRSLGMATTAEGVETEAQLDAVRGEGCTEIQGFLFSPPLSAAGVEEFLALMPGMSPKPREQQQAS